MRSFTHWLAHHFPLQDPMPGLCQRPTTFKIMRKGQINSLSDIMYKQTLATSE
ncbi:MAG: hypothetical protein ACFCUU_00120 [Cyclobacteriaceae bacterium]